MNNEERKFFNHWKSGHLSLIIETFKTAIEEAGEMPLEAFHYFVKQWAQEAYDIFTEELDVVSPEDIPKQFAGDLFAAIVGGFNSALPSDYKYIIIGVFSDKSDGVRIGVSERKNIPGYHDIVNTNIVPILNLKNTVLPKGDGRVSNIKIDDVNFGNEDLEKTI